MGTEQMESVDFKDIVYAETITSLCGQKLQDASQERRGVLKDFAQQLYGSLYRTERADQKVVGIDLSNKEVAIRKIEEQVREIIATRCHIEQDEDVPQGHVKGTVILLQAGCFRVSGSCGGRSFQVDANPRAFGLELGSEVLIKPLSDRPERGEHVRIPAEFVRIF